LESHTGEAETFAAVDAVNNHSQIIGRILSAVRDVGIEESLALKIVPNIAAAFLEEVFVNSAFGINGQELAQLLSVEARSGDSDTHTRASRYGEC
jgi:hypothetical protein